MRWPLVRRGRLLEAYANLQRAQDRIDDLEHLVDIHREKERRVELDLRDTDRRRLQLERELDSTDPFSISRRAAQNANAQAGELVACLLEKQRLVAAGKPVPERVEEVIRKGSKTWSTKHKADDWGNVAPDDNTKSSPPNIWPDPIC